MIQMCRHAISELNPLTAEKQKRQKRKDGPIKTRGKQTDIFVRITHICNGSNALPLLIAASSFFVCTQAITKKAIN